MPDPQPPYLADELARFRAAVDAAVERGRRAADDARAAGAAFHRETEALGTANRLPAPDLDAPDAPPAAAARRPAPPEDEDFSQFRIMRPL